MNKALPIANTRAPNALKLPRAAKVREENRISCWASGISLQNGLLFERLTVPTTPVMISNRLLMREAMPTHNSIKLWRAKSTWKAVQMSQKLLNYNNPILQHISPEVHKTTLLLNVLILNRLFEEDLDSNILETMQWNQTKSMSWLYISLKTRSDLQKLHALHLRINRLDILTTNTQGFRSPGMQGLSVSVFHCLFHFITAN